MRKLTFTLALTFVAVPLFAASPERSHSYFTYDDGGTVIKQGEDGREIEARVNLPVFPGDEVTTSRRGRAEIRLADGNIIALDRGTTVRFQSILDSYDGDNAQTVVELRTGHVACASMRIPFSSQPCVPAQIWNARHHRGAHTPPRTPSTPTSRPHRPLVAFAVTSPKASASDSHRLIILL